MLENIKLYIVNHMVSIICDFIIIISSSVWEGFVAFPK